MRKSINFDSSSSSSSSFISMYMCVYGEITREFFSFNLFFLYVYKIKKQNESIKFKFFIHSNLNAYISSQLLDIIYDV